MLYSRLQGEQKRRLFILDVTTSPALASVYGHQRTKNIESLEWFCSKVYSTIFHLVPFCDGRRQDAAPACENSLFFHGYMAQGWNALKRSDSDDSIFVSNDLIVNPLVNGSGYRMLLGINRTSSFTPVLLESHHRSYFRGGALMTVQLILHIKRLDVAGML